MLSRTTLGSGPDNVRRHNGTFPPCTCESRTSKGDRNAARTTTEMLDNAITFAAGMVYGVTSTAVGQPFDTVKVSTHDA